MDKLGNSPSSPAYNSIYETLLSKTSALDKNRTNKFDLPQKEERFFAIRVPFNPNDINQSGSKGLTFKKIDPAEITVQNFNDILKDLHLILIKKGEKKEDPPHIEIRPTHEKNAEKITQHLAKGDPIILHRDGKVSKHETKHIEINTFTDKDLGVLGQALREYFILSESSKQSDPDQVDKPSLLRDRPTISKSELLKKREKVTHTSSAPSMDSLKRTAINSVFNKQAAKRKNDLREAKRQEESDIKKEKIKAQEERLELKRNEQKKEDIEKSFPDSSK